MPTLLELGIVACLFVFAAGQFALTTVGLGTERAALSLAMFMALVASYLGLSIGRIRLTLGAAAHRTVWVRFAGPLALVVVVAAYAAVSHASIASLVLPYTAYLLAPCAVLVSRTRRSEARDRGGPPVRILVALLLLWLPLVLWMPAVRLSRTYDGSHLIALVAGLYLFLIVERLSGVGFTFRLSGRDVRLASQALSLYVLVALPLGLATGFLAWHLRASRSMILISPLRIYLATALPEEFLFRGVMQNVLVEWLGVRSGLAAAATIFGLAHLPDPRYVVLAALAGVAYGWVYQRTSRITASAVTHAAVDWIWLLAFRRV